MVIWLKSLNSNLVFWACFAQDLGLFSSYAGLGACNEGVKQSFLHLLLDVYGFQASPRYLFEAASGINNISSLRDLEPQ